ncbi:unnamed protein product, partial [Amoebophrya sp. A120]
LAVGRWALGDFPNRDSFGKYESCQKNIRRGRFSSLLQNFNCPCSAIGVILSLIPIPPTT